MPAIASTLARGAALLVATGLLSACGRDRTPPAPAVAPPTPPMAQHTPPPDYPADLACRQVGGEVVLDVQLAASGVPVDVAVFRSSGVKALDDLAVAAVREWQ